MNYISAFKESVQQNAEKPALVDFDGTRQTTYKELDRLSSRVAGKLHAAGCSKGSFIPVLIERRMEYMAAYLGVLKAGCVVVPLIPEIPKERISYIIEHCEAKLTIDISFFDDIEIYEPFENLAGDDESALLIYTSGSTGTPKGILHTNSSLFSSAERTKILSEGVSPIIFAAAAPFSFIIHIQEYLCIFLLSGCVHILSNIVTHSLPLLEEYYTRHSITAGYLTPKIIPIFTPPSSLQKICTGGDSLLSSPVSGNYRISYLYGQGETCSAVCTHLIENTCKNPSLGKALPGIEIRILDESGNEVPHGLEGEICVIGEFGVEYFKSPEETKGTFIKTDDGKTLIHTGDIGFIDEAGDLHYVTRKDWMVKINGQRVETLEVERVLQSVEHIKEAAVKAFSDADSQNYLVGYYVSDAELSSDDIRISLSEKLPPYMIPRYLVRLDAIPKNQNGKTDRNVLTSPDISLYKTVYVAPSTPEEQALCSAFEEVLDCEKVGIHDDFFALGGDSIKVMKLLAAEPVKGLTLDSIVKGKTPETIAYLSSAAEENNSAEDTHLDTYPLTRTQKEVAAACMRNPDAAMYNNPMLCKLENGADIEKLKNAIITAVNAHPYIKATLIADEAGELRAQRNDDDAVQISVITCDTLPDLQTFVRPFNLIESPLYRIEIYSSNDGIYLFADFHHIICDGTSLMILLDDISKSYLGEDIEAESYTGFDAALTEEKARTGTKYQQDKEYYTNLLEECDTDSTLYPDSVSEEENLGITEHICTADFKDVKKFCSKHSISENAFFNAVFSLVLSKYTDSTDVLYATVYNGRNDSRLSRTFTMQVKTFPVFSQIQNNESFVEFARDVQTRLLNGMAHDLYSFAEIINSCRLNVENYFVYQADLFNPTEFAGEKITQIPLHPNAARFALRISLSVVDNKLNLLGEFRTNTYSEFLIQSFLISFDAAVKECLNVNLLSEISLIIPAAAHLLNEFNATDAAYNSAETIIDGFHESVLKHQDKTAVVFKDTRLTYKELDEITDNLADYLCRNGVGAETVVGILVPRNEYMPICALGVLKAGGAYLPLDPTYPKDRLNFMMKDSGAVLLIADKSLDGLIDEFCGKRLFTEDIASLPNCSSLLPNPNPEDLFEILYTSGSTGIPKGVMVKHQNAAAFSSAWIARSHELDETARVSAYASFGFDAAIADMYPTILCGAELHIIPEELRLDLIGLREYFNTRGITHSFMTTQIGRQFALLGGCTTLKEQEIGGEKLIPFAPPHHAFYNTYGPTECIVAVTTIKLENQHTNSSIGKPLNNVRCYVVDKCGMLLPPGAVGELWLSGPQVARGYLNRPEKTAEVFTKNTFSTHPAHSVVYHTGDIVRYLSDGTIQFIGRHDSQVKIRGFRIELTEVEEVISRFTGIKDAAVAAYDSPAGGKYLAAYVVSDKPVDIKALNAFIAAEKPPYMVPAVTIQLDVLPHNQNMKVNRKALPVPELTAADAVPPQNELQQKLYDIVANVLGHSGFGINTNFTDAGLTSISSVQLLLLLNREFNMTVKLAVILEHNTVEKLAEYLQNSEEDNEGIPYEIQETYPLTQAQKEIAATCMRNPDAAIYNLPGLYKLERNTDIEKLKSAIITAVNAHPYIKATLIADESGELRAQRNDDDTVHLSVITCDTLPDLQTFVRPFNLIESPLYRIEIYSSNDGLYLFADFHHIICDGTSLMILLSDISKAYLGEDIETESYTGFDAALTEEKARAGTKYQQDKEYYTNLLEECDTDSTLYPDSVSEEENLGITEHICTADFKDVKKFCSKHSISENAFFNAVFSLVLSKYTDSTEVLYATVYDGRNDSRLSCTFTMQVKTFPVFSQIQKNESFVQFARDVQTHLLNGMAHDLYSFAEILTSCRLNVENYFVYQADSFNPTEFAGEKITQIPLHPNTARSALRISLSVVDNKLKLNGKFRTNTYSEFLIQSFLTSFDTAVKECLTVNLLSEISLITPAAAHLLNEFNATDAAYNSTQTVVDGFHESVLKHQDKTAVVFKDTRLTYKELDEITDNLAEYLCKNGVGAETVVGILIPRNEYMPICALGVLKAGGAYLPLDPSYPKDRLNFMLKDSDAVLLIADKSLDGLIDEFSGIRLFTDEIKSLPNCSSLLPKPNAKDLFAVLYTSGSTGIPKGVILTHQNIAAFCSAWIARSHELDETARVGAYASFGFDVAIEDIFPTLLCGAELHIILEELRLDLIGLRTYFNTHGITHCHMTTQIGRQFALLGGFTSLKEQMVGGEKLVPLIPPSYAFYETYGPTECTVLVTTFKLETRHTNNSIGKPLNNVRCYVVDKCGLLLPPGAVGELWLSGPQVARGYLNRPEKTAEVFTKNTFSTHPAHSVVYHTGDIVRYLSDGNIQFIGRHDSQVKIRGFRIELTEVEEVISRFTGIKDAAVAAYDSPAGGKYLAAYVVSDKPVDIKALNAFIAAEKPPYMVPSVTIQLDVLPHNQNMKVNRKALPVPELTAADAVPPQNELQQKLYDIVANVLGHSGFGINTNFTDAGLTSISSVQLMVHLSREFNVSVKLGAILEHNTIEKLAEYLLTADADVRYEILPDYPLTPIQYSTFVECVANPGTPIYNIPFLLHLGNTTDIAKIETAVKAAVNAHPYLKMVLSVNSNGEIRAKRNDDAEVNFRIIRTHSLPDSKTLVRPYDLMQFNTPLYRIELYQTDDGNYLFMDFSHIYFDGESQAILEKDLIRAYSGESLDRETYTGYEAALDEQKRLISKEFIDAQQYSENLMKTSGPVATIPFNSDTNDGKILNAIRFCNLDTDKVKAYCSQNALTLNSFFNAALSIVLSKYTALKKGLYATLYNGRNDVKLMNSVALLVKMLLIPYSLNLTASFTAYAHTIQDIILNDIKYDIYPFAKVLQDNRLDVRKGIYLAYQPEMSLSVPFGNDPAEVVLMDVEGMKSSISANIALVDGVFVFFFTYSTAQYTSELMDAFLEDLETTCSEGILNPVLSEMSVLSGVSFAEDTLLITHETSSENREDADVSNAIQGEIVPPQNELQQMIFEIAAELLGHRTFGITTSLYSVGLESFTAVTLIVLLGQKFNVYLQFSEMHEYDTIEKIAAYIAAVNVK